MPDEDDDLIDDVVDEEIEDNDEEDSGSEDGTRDASDTDGDSESENRRRRRRRRRRGGRNDRSDAERSDVPRPMSLDAPQPDIVGVPFNGETYDQIEGSSSHGTSEDGSEGEGNDAEGRGRRRGRRGGRRLRRDRDDARITSVDLPHDVHAGDEGADVPVSPWTHDDMTTDDQPVLMFTHEPFEAVDAPAVAMSVEHDAPETADVLPVVRPRRGRPPRRVEPVALNDVVESEQVVVADHVDQEIKGSTDPLFEPVRIEAASPSQPVEPPTPSEPETTEPVVLGADNKPRRGGWWARKP